MTHQQACGKVSTPSPPVTDDICQKFVDRSRCQATDGFIVYDIQDESSRNADARPFPFRRTMDPAEFASLFPSISGKSAVLYKVRASRTHEH